MVIGLGVLIGSLSLLEARVLSFEERVAAQRAIETVDWHYRLWPADNPDPKPPLDGILSDEALRAKVADGLRASTVLEHDLERPITAAELQAELNRMARDTRQPARLAELFSALGNDPFLVAECLARPILAERLLAQRVLAETASSAGGDALEPGTSGTIQISGPDSGEPEPLRPGYVRPSTLTDDIEPQRSLSLGPQTDDTPYTLPQITAPLTCTDDTWTPTSTTGVSPGRVGHAAVWTGSEMIVWGGCNSVPLPLTGGHRYDPATDSWSLLPPPPAGSGGGCGTSAVWTGTLVIVWGGGYAGDFNSEDWNQGGRFNPVTNSWQLTSTGSGVPGPRYGHSAVWTGTRMIVWGGSAFTGPGGVSTILNTGGQYDPVADTWSPTRDGFVCTAGARSGQFCESAGDCPGTCNGGTVPGESCQPSDPNACLGACSLNPAIPCRTNPQCASHGAGQCTAPPAGTCANVGTCQNLVYAPSARAGHTAVWTGSRMIVWGGGSQTGARYDPGTDEWTPTSTGANVPSTRANHTAVWTGSEMIVWGGSADTTGGRYDPVSDSWTPTSTGANVPAPRSLPTSVWTGSEMIVWGGYNGVTATNTGGRYAPATDSWRATSTGAGDPSARASHSAVWTGNEMIVWGGGTYVNTGGRYCASSACAVATWYRDADGDGYGRTSDTVLSCTQPPGYTAYGGDCNEANPAIHPGAAEACDGIDSDCDGNPNPLAPAGSSSMTASRTGPSTAQLSWTPLAGATAYDVVRGSLTSLASTHGDFTAATDLCVANDLAATTKPDPGMPAAGTGSWYLVRGSNCGGPGTYDSGAPSQVGARDAEIQASAAACP